MSNQVSQITFKSKRLGTNVKVFFAKISKTTKQKKTCYVPLIVVNYEILMTKT